jgi:hypothetical protein
MQHFKRSLQKNLSYLLQGGLALVAVPVGDDRLWFDDRSFGIGSGPLTAATSVLARPWADRR